MARQARARLLLTLAVALCVWPGASTTLAASGDRDGDGLRDSWEQRWGITSARDRDSDDDGIPDSAEDPDGDGLSNLGEQHFGTSPVDADTDGDGTDDWREDSDHDGRRDGREQDRRKVPASLKPSLRTALYDLPLRARAQCHTKPNDALLHPCVFGDPKGKVRVTLFGDSHALQWLPALEKAAKSQGWRVVSLTKSACPAVNVRYDHKSLSGDAKSCRTWRARAERWIRTHRQDLVIVANSRGYKLLDSRGKRLTLAAANAAWEQGLARTLDTMPASAKLLVLGDTPTPGRNVPACLRAHATNISACQRSKADSLMPGRDAAEQRAAADHGATFRSPSSRCALRPVPPGHGQRDDVA
ncbi:MAG: SGNH hydrolase domain-containing protein [Chloroflexota bacterium]